MAVTIRFTKATAKPKKPKQSGSKKKTLTKLNSFLKQAEPETVEFLLHDLKATGNAVTYKELREAYLGGGMTQEQFEKWQHKYSKLVTGTLKPKWEQAAAEAAQEIKDKYPYFLYEPGTGAAADWIKQHGAELVTNLAQDQMDALNAMVGYFSGNTAITPDEAARMMRPCIGLTKPQAVANLRYQDAVKAAWKNQHPNAKQETLDKKAKEAGARYAARQHRYRAQSIARTELAFGYNAGAYGATKDAQAQGYIGECKKKWLTAYDERVCPICSAMDEETADMDAPFSNGKLLPPGHPQCRCAVAYEEVDSANLNPQTANGTMGTQAQPQNTPQPQQPAAAQPAAPQPQQPPLVQTTPADPNAPQIPPDVDVPPGMTYKGPAHLGGTGEMHIYQDADGKEWLFKPAQDKGGSAPVEFRAYVQEAGYKVQGIVDPKTAVKVGTGNLDGKFGAFQEKLETWDTDGLKKWQHGGIYGFEDYDLQDNGVFEEIQREHVTDWLLGNYDSHGGNFVSKAGGQLIGIDKEQSFKYISDPKSHTMSYTYHPNSKYGETEPVYNTMFRKYAKGEIDLDLNESLKYIQRVEQIPDAEYREIFRNYAESLHGPGADAEKLLDAIVERKANLRETYRTFYTQLETERKGVKTVFQFSDEIAGTAVPKPAPKPKAPKMPKTPKAPTAAPKPTKTPVKTESGYKMSDVLDDPTVLPNSQFGVAIQSDGKMLEGLNMSGRTVTINGADYYEFTGKLTDDAWRAAEKNARQRGYTGKMDFLKRDANGEHFAGSTSLELDAAKILTPSQSSFEIYSEYANAGKYSFNGQFRIRVPKTGNPATDRKAIEEIMDKSGLKALTHNTTAASELAAKKARLAWQLDPKKVASVRGATEAVQENAIEEILRDAGITKSRLAKMQYVEVYPGYSTFVDEGAVKAYKKAGLTHVWSGVDEADSVVAILQSDGLACSNQRFMNGMGKAGASSFADMKSGGASSVFTRMGARVPAEYKDANVAGDTYRFILKPELAERTDWYAFDGDAFGRCVPGSCFDDRQSALEFVSEMSKKPGWDSGYQDNNEMCFRYGISNDNILGISCQNDRLRTNLLDKLRAAGIHEIQGVPIEDFCRVTTRIEEDADLGLMGLSFYNNPPPLF